ncbi:MAG: hypothetical protein ABFE07_13275 [Armatimonadia bacterium]
MIWSSGECGLTNSTDTVAAAAVAGVLALSPEEREAALLREEPQWQCLPLPDEISRAA